MDLSPSTGSWDLMKIAAGIIPVRKVDLRFEFLLLRCFSYWDFPKGEIEDHEDPWEAALRELKEETGITQIKLNWGKAFCETEVYSKGKIARYYLVETNAQSKIELLPNPETGIIEHHEYRWVDFDQANTLIVPRLQKILVWANQLISS